MQSAKFLFVVCCFLASTEYRSNAALRGGKCKFYFIGLFSLVLDYKFRLANKSLIFFQTRSGHFILLVDLTDQLLLYFINRTYLIKIYIALKQRSQTQLCSRATS